MTRSQVRAAMRRMREHNDELEEEHGELNLVPYMDIVTNIIIFLLASVVNQVSLANVNVSVPTLSAGGSASDDQPERAPLNLTVTVSSGGFIIAASGGVLPTVPRLSNGLYDYPSLTKKLGEIKSNAENASETKVTFNADSGTPYEIVVATLDAIREDDAGKILFPDVNFSAGLL